MNEANSGGPHFTILCVYIVHLEIEHAATRLNLFPLLLKQQDEVGVVLKAGHAPSCLLELDAKTQVFDIPIRATP